MSTVAGLHAGAADVDITPPMGVEMCGYGAYEKRVCTDVLDPLHARALWLEAGGTAVVIVALDVCMVDLALHRAVAAVLTAKAGLDETRLMLCASHTHSGPAVQPTIAWGECDAAYVARLGNLLADVALKARDAACPARLGATRVRIRDVGVNREQPLIGPTDTAAQFLRVDRLDGTPLAVIYNYGAHGVVRYPFTARISADWPGLVSACIQKELGCPALFLQGPCANINAHHMSFSRQDPELEQKLADTRTGAVAEVFCNQAIPVLRALPTQALDRIEARWHTIELPCAAPAREPLEAQIREYAPRADSHPYAWLRPLHTRLTTETDEERAWREARWKVDSARCQLRLLDQPPYVRRAPLHVLKLGEIVMVGWPAEVFVETGIEVRQRSPFPLTFVSTFTNDTAGYIPTPAVYESKGRGNDFGRYPREMTHLVYGDLPYRSDVGRILVDETMAMLNAL